MGYNPRMNQRELEMRYRTLTKYATKNRMKCLRREDISGPQFGVIVNDDHTIWRKLPKDPAEDEQFVKDLCDVAKATARKQD